MQGCLFLHIAALAESYSASALRHVLELPQQEESPK